MPHKRTKRRTTKPQRPQQRNNTQRLQRLLASAGFGSRRQCEELIAAGRVDVDGQIVTKLGTTVDPEVNKVQVDGTPLKQQKLVYYAVNKPIGVVTTNRDPQGRPRVVDLVPPDERVFPVGRLDRNSEGLILLTNDGELSQRLTHPKFGVRKVYRVTVAGKVDGETMRQMRKGIYIAEGFVKVEGAKLLKTRSRATEMEIVLREGKNREIRRILARLGHKVQHLRRIAVGPLKLGDVPPGAYRVVRREEVRKLWEATEQGDDPHGRVNQPARARRRQVGGARHQQSGNRAPSGRPGAGSQDKARRSVKKQKPSLTDLGVSRSQRGGAVIGGDAPAESDAPQRGSAARPRRRQSKATTPKRKSTKRSPGRKRNR